MRYYLPSSVQHLTPNSNSKYFVDLNERTNTLTGNIWFHKAYPYNVLILKSGTIYQYGTSHNSV